MNLWKCPDCKEKMFLEEYDKKFGKVAAIGSLMIFFIALFLLPVQAYNISSTNCSDYLVYDTGNKPLGCGDVPTNNTALSVKGWGKSYSNELYYWNLSGTKAFSDSWVLTVGGGDTVENYKSVTPPVTCNLYFKPRTGGYGSGLASIFGINSAGGFLCAGGVRWDTSQTKIMYTAGTYTASAYDIDWGNWQNMTFYYKDNSNCTIRWNDAEIYNGASQASSGHKFQLFPNMGTGENPMMDNIRCWAGTPDQEPKEWVEPPLPPSTVYPVYNINNVSNSNNSIYVAWSYNNSANGGVMIMRDSVNIANVTYSTSDYNFTGLINNTAYNVTLFSYNSTAINYSVNSGNSQTYKTQQYLTILPIILYNVNLTFPINYTLIRNNPLNYSFKADFNTTGCYLYSDIGLGYSLRSFIISDENTTNNLNINQTYNLSQTFNNNTYANVSAFVDCNLSNGTQIRSNYVSFPYNNDFTALPINFIYPANNSILNVTNIFVNFSIGEPEICVINDTLWNLFITNYTFYSFRETTALEDYYSINISCVDYSNNSATGSINFQKNYSYGAMPPYGPHTGYNNSYVNNSLFNLQGLNTTTTSGVMMFFLYLIIAIAFAIIALWSKIPLLIVIVGIFMEIFAFLFFVSLSVIVGIMFALFGIIMIFIGFVI